MAAPIYVVVCNNDKPSKYNGRVDPDGPLVWEQYTRGATLEAAMTCAARLEVNGACRVGRVVFEDEPGFEVAP